MSEENGKALALFNQFQTELEQAAGHLGNLLPRHITRDRFLSSALVAVKHSPALLMCHRRSLHNAITKAAYDELLPDGREGVIIPRKEKTKRGEVVVAVWQPMVHGIRKRAAQFGIIIDGKVIYANDKVEWEEGLNPILRVTPTPLDQNPGDMIGAFAVFRRNGQIVHHEVMRRIDILKVKAVSRQPNGVMWQQFEDQAWIKTVVRRGAKSVPDVPDKLQQIIERHDDDFDFNQDRDETPAIEHEPTVPDDPLAEPDGAPSVDDDEGADADFSQLYPEETVQVATVTRIKPPSRKGAA